MLRKIALLVVGIVLVFTLAPSAVNAQSTVTTLFPLKPGTKLAYAIQASGTIYTYQHQIWPIEGNRAKGKLCIGQLKATAGKTYELEFTVLGPVQWQPTFDLIDTSDMTFYQIAVTKDTLGLYGNVKNLYWAVVSAGEVWEFQTFDKSYSPPMTENVVADGFSFRLLAFVDEPGTVARVKLNEGDELEFVNAESSDDGLALHLCRRIKVAASSFSLAFSDDIWIVLGKGITRFQQRVDGKLTMTGTQVAPTGVQTNPSGSTGTSAVLPTFNFMAHLS